MRTDGQIFRIMQRLKKAAIPVLKMNIEKMEVIGSTYKGQMRWFAMFDADSWAAEKAQHPFEGCNPDFILWDSKTRGRAKIAFLIR